MAEEKTFKGIKIGQKFIVIANRGGHNYPMGKTLTFSRNGIDGTTMNDCMVDKEGRSHNSIMIDEIQLVYETVVQMKDQIKKLNASHTKELATLQFKIDTCEELGMEVYDEDFVKIYKALQALNSDATILEKTKLIVKLINL